ncbi:MAG: hypothetical protein V4574_18825 [Pseudomonadota bacterium]
MPNSLRYAAAALAMLCLAGCSANHNSIYRMKTFDPAGASVVLIDARQRAILSAPRVPVDPNKPGPPSRYCLEPPPDVFTVAAQSASGSGTFGQGADPKAVQAALSAAFSSSEQGATIQRTQTVNLLGQMLLSTCIRTMNGDLSALELPIQAIRDQRMVQGTLAIESLTAALAPRTVVIGAGGSASTGGSGSDAALVDKAAQAIVDGKAKLKTAQDAYDKLEGGACPALKVRKDKGETLTADEITKEGNCAKALTTRNEAKDAVDAATDRYEAVKAAASGKGLPVSATTNPAAIIAGTTAPPSPALTAEITRAVEHIVELSYQQDEFLLFCLKVFSPVERVNITGADSIEATCIEYVKSGINRETARNNAEIATARSDAIEHRQTEFDAFWAIVAADGGATADPTKLGKAIDAALKAHPGPARRNKTTLTTMRSVTSKDELRRQFGMLTGPYPDALQGK